jgi:transcriptional regulator GlxA family with amidase domain
MIKIAILAMHNAASSTISGPMDIFHSAGVLWNYTCGTAMDPRFETRIVTLDGKPVKCLNNLMIKPHCSVDEVGKTDIVLISSIMDIGKVLKHESKAISWLKSQYEKGSAIASICTGAYVLAETGLLDGKTATTHWGYLEEFRQRYPKIELKPERLITDEGDLYCSGASNACLDLAIYLVEKYCDHGIAVKCAKGMLIDLGRFAQTPYSSILDFQKSHGDETIIKSQQQLEKNYTQKIDIDRLASTLSLGRRTFERRFKKATGDTPLLYLQRIRIEAAKKMLELNERTFDEITYEVGYENSSFFRKLFKKHTDLTPKEYRNKFRAL